MNNKPKITLRDGNLKVAIWRNESAKGAFYSITPPTRGYKDGAGAWKETTSLSDTQLLQASRLLERAYDAILNLKDQDKEGGQ